MGAGHQVISIADRRRSLRLNRPVDGREFAKHVSLANDEPAGFRRAAHMLGQAAQHRAFAYGISLAQVRAVFDHRMARDVASLPDDYVVFHNGKGADPHVTADLGLGTNNGQRMNVHR